MTWNDYEKLTQANSSYLLSYLEGVITIVSPSKNHEVIERTISILINAYCRQYNLLYFPLGSTTLKNPETVGKEPDTSYAFGSSKDVPDLAVEVVFSSGETPRPKGYRSAYRRKTQTKDLSACNAHQESGGTADLIKYQYLRVGEVWLWQNEEIKFYQLVDSQYVEITTSSCLPNLSAEFLIEFINRGLTESPLTIEADFVSKLNS